MPLSHVLFGAVGTGLVQGTQQCYQWKGAGCVQGLSTWSEVLCGLRTGASTRRHACFRAP